MDSLTFESDSGCALRLKI